MVGGDGMSERLTTVTKIRHWLPILTFCPVNNLPDLLYFEVEFHADPSQVFELYAIRKKVRELTSMKKNFMEDLALRVLMNMPQAKAVTVTLALGRHVHRVERHV